MINLKHKTDTYLANGGSLNDHDDILLLSLEKNDQDGLNQVIRLAKDDYGGFTYKWELKHSANIIVLNWGEKGLDALLKMAIEDQQLSNINGAITLFSYVSCGKAEDYPYVQKRFESYKRLKITSKKYQSEKLKLHAKKLLVELIKEVEKEDKFPFSLIHSLQTSYMLPEAQEQIFTSMIIRWFHLSGKSIEKYHTLINSKKNSEPECHRFLKENPFVLEPVHSKVWSKPRCGESFVPDFLIRLMDNSYAVIEIEDPNKPIITKSGNLSSQATHARRQALEYREWIISNNLYAQNQFSGIWRPNAIVIIGMEGQLSAAQKKRLNQENESTQGVVKIVGFDWVYERAKISFENMLKFGFEK